MDEVSHAEVVSESAIDDTVLSEDLALVFLKRSDLSPEAIERLSKNGSVTKYRKVKLALVEHPRTPRHITLPILRSLYTFDLMQVALQPVVAADIKLAAEESLIQRMETISSGEKLTLAHRASGRVAGELLLDSEPRVVHAALENPRLTEAPIIKALMRTDVSAALIEAVCRDAKWSLRREIRLALLRNEKTPLARTLEFARTLPLPQVLELLQMSRLPDNVKAYLQSELKQNL